ncbi:hypothetical protein [Streptomyces sp. NPDC093589]|uniref:hypothetical protein n=1 Tax=Streptomyces sp. NPDC093589 TaxID=3366043 RepID=UPI0037FC1E32
MPYSEPDFRLDGYQAVNDRVADAFWQHIELNQDQLMVLAEHHSDDARHSYYVAHDASVTWGIPGESQIVALHLQRDAGQRTFRFQSETLPLPAMAQSWLIARGCPRTAIALTDGSGPTPADDATRSLEDRLLSDGDQFALLTSYTDDTSTKPATTVLLRATDEREPQPFRVLLEEVDTDTWTRRLREGRFTTFQDATTWWERHWSGDPAPLPTGPPVRQHAPLPPRTPPVSSKSLRGPSR